MSDFNFFFGLIPERAYKYIVAGLLVLLIFRQRIPILNKIDVKVSLPEDFMRNFRWITPLLVVCQYFFLIAIYLVLKAILAKLP